MRSRTGHQNRGKCSRDRCRSRFARVVSGIQDVTDEAAIGKRSRIRLHFPYSDAQFDFAFLTSVFTHLLRRT